MPRVSEAHIAARRQQILDAARVCFTRSGFHATSMQDVIVEAGLSVGAVYRYFRSKEDLIRAIAEEFAGGIVGRLERLISAEPPLTPDRVLAEALKIVDPELQPGGTFRLAMQVWSESFRNPTLAEFVRDVYTRMRAIFIALVERAQVAGHLPADADPVATGSALFALLPGYGLQRVLIGDPDPQTYLTGVRTLLSRGDGTGRPPRRVEGAPVD